MANGLYANGRHQCEVIIDVVKETCGPDGVWGRSLLTDEERASVAVVSCSEHDNQTLTAGWSCDKERNEFVLGLWMDSPSEEFEYWQVAGDVGEASGESISRYLRCDPNAPVGAEVFMARVVIGGGIYTSDGLSKGVGSTVTISAVAPFELKASDLDLYMDNQGYIAGATYRTEVHIYYWTPPGKMQFVRNLGFERPLNLPGEGEDFKSTLFYQNPLENRWSNVVGTVVHKDNPSARLYLDEIRPGLPAPSANPQCRFNERPTIMRAVRLKSTLTAENNDTKSFWRLLDNYGTEQKFTLTVPSVEVPGHPYLILGGAIAPPPRKLVHFEIKLPNGLEYTRELYPNDRHQCVVFVEIIAEQWDPDKGWEAVRLTQAELDSFAITQFSADPDAPLPEGWSCDKQKNIFDAGLRSQSREKGRQTGDSESSRSSTSMAVEIVYRYMRRKPNLTVIPAVFMATIEVGGVKYSTNYQVGDVNFNSRVIIHPQESYRLLVTDLVEYVDNDAFADEQHNVKAYYWMPPPGLRFLVNRGFDNPVPAWREGASFRTSYLYRRDFRFYAKGGVVINKDVLNPVVTLEDIVLEQADGREKYIRLNKYPTIMRAVVALVSDASNPHLDTKSNWRLWDNFGVEHVFRLEQYHWGERLRLVKGD
ncbi:hypothetical protein [Pseudomonas synxantha]|uniref:hypothetical protein n=1 Tax=Pseudomonas synxantha TaxID=47883 RepID=UPI000F57AD11|nr:hypothetical protein [Pseudomonas synxantha]